MNRILTISIAATLVIASITGTALAKDGHGGGHNHGSTSSHDRAPNLGGHAFVSHDSMPGSGSGGDSPWYLTSGNEAARVR
jgi:hypothetical protein